MTYLLDVNALLALGFLHHEFHARMATWVRKRRFLSLATCSITELGFVRVMAQAQAYGFTIAQARTLLLRLKKSPVLSIAFISDDRDIASLPAWVKSPGQTTDGHLLALAKANGAELATFNEKIPGAFLIP
jgi:predicted nucleic acid-binding protein